MVEAAEAGRLESEIRRWREPADLVLQWWDRQSREYTQRQGPGASTHLPHALSSIMGQAGVFTPEECSRATAIAEKICQCREVPFPSQVRGRDQQGRQVGDDGTGGPTLTSASGTAPVLQDAAPSRAAPRRWVDLTLGFLTSAFLHALSLAEVFIC